MRRDLVERLEPTVTGWFDGRTRLPIATTCWTGLRLPHASNHRHAAGSEPRRALAGVRLLQQVADSDEIGRHVERLVARYRAEADAGGFAVARQPRRRGGDRWW